MSPEVVAQLFRGKLIHRCRDQWGDILVMDKGDDRVLSFDTLYEQSRINKKHPAQLAHLYTRAMLLGLAFIEPRHVTMLGLGSGSLVHVFDEMFSQASLSVVECRELVVEVARQYFWLPTSPNIEITVTDAQCYLQKTATASTDIIFSDLYTADDMSPLQLRETFLRDSHRILSDEGWLVINFHQIPDTSSEFFVMLEKLFKEILIFTIPDENYIIYAGKQRLLTDLDHYMNRTKWFPCNDKLGYEKLFKRIVQMTI